MLTQPLPVLDAHADALAARDAVSAALRDADGVRPAELVGVALGHAVAQLLPLPESDALGEVAPLWDGALLAVGVALEHLDGDAERSALPLRTADAVAAAVAVVLTVVHAEVVADTHADWVSVRDAQAVADTHALAEGHLDALAVAEALPETVPLADADDVPLSVTRKLRVPTGVFEVLCEGVAVREEPTLSDAVALTVGVVDTHAVRDRAGLRESRALPLAVTEAQADTDSVAETVAVAVGLGLAHGEGDAVAVADSEVLLDTQFEALLVRVTVAVREAAALQDLEAVGERLGEPLRSDDALLAAEAVGRPDRDGVSVAAADALLHPQALSDAERVILREGEPLAEPHIEAESAPEADGETDGDAVNERLASVLRLARDDGLAGADADSEGVADADGESLRDALGLGVTAGVALPVALGRGVVHALDNAVVVGDAVAHSDALPVAHKVPTAEPVRIAAAVTVTVSEGVPVAVVVAVTQADTVPGPRDGVAHPVPLPVAVLERRALPLGSGPDGVALPQLLAETQDDAVGDAAALDVLRALADAQPEAGALERDDGLEYSVFEGHAVALDETDAAAVRVRSEEALGELLPLSERDARDVAEPAVVTDAHAEALALRRLVPEADGDCEGDRDGRLVAVAQPEGEGDATPLPLLALLLLRAPLLVLCALALAATLLAPLAEPVAV